MSDHGLRPSIKILLTFSTYFCGIQLGDAIECCVITRRTSCVQCFIEVHNFGFCHYTIIIRK